MKRSHGFSLVEMAIVLLIIGLLIGGLMGPLGAQMEASRIKDTQNQINNILDALYGFAAANGRLPCPATANSAGSEDVAAIATGQCTAPYNGFIPGRQLGLGPLDANGYVLDSWGQPIHYAVADLKAANSTYPITGVPSQVQTRGIKFFTDSSLIGISALGNLAPNQTNTPPASSFLSVCASATGIATVASAYTSSGTIGSCGIAGNTLSSDAVAVVYSTGPNAGGVATGADEAANPNPSSANNDSAFVSHVRTEAGAPGGYFDDIVVWIPRSILVSKLLAAGQLP